MSETTKKILKLIIKILRFSASQFDIFIKEEEDNLKKTEKK